MATEVLKTTPFMMDLWSSKAPYTTVGRSCVVPIWAQYNKTIFLFKRVPILLLKFKFIDSQKQGFVDMR